MRRDAGKLLVVSGPSGAGKSTVIRKMMAGREDIRFSVSATTRAPRDGEVDGKDYFPINADGNATFAVPVVFDKDMTASAETVAMSEPHIIEYTLHFDASTLKDR